MEPWTRWARRTSAGRAAVSIGARDMQLAVKVPTTACADSKKHQFWLNARWNTTIPLFRGRAHSVRTRAGMKMPLGRPVASIALAACIEIFWAKACHFGCGGRARAALGRENTLTRHFFTISCPVAARGGVREIRITGYCKWQSCSLSCNKTDSGKKRGRSRSSSRRHVGREPCGIPPLFSPVWKPYFRTRDENFTKKPVLYEQTVLSTNRSRDDFDGLLLKKSFPD